MNKWFDKNLANYAKSALLEAQKRIDQVLDIKEDEIISKFKLPATESSATVDVVSSASALVTGPSQSDMSKQDEPKSEIYSILTPID
jgi:hypothetical protein